MIDTYTRFLETVAETGDAEVAERAVGRLIAHLKSTGRVKILPQILRALRKRIARHHTLRPYVEVAREKDSAQALSNAAFFGIRAKRAIVNPSLIYGWRARGRGAVVDRSAKQALITIYQKVIA